MFKKIITFLFTLMLIGSVAFADDMCSCENSSKTAPSFTDDGHTFTMKIMCLDCNLPKSVETRITHTWVNGACECGETCSHDYENGKCEICGMKDPDHVACDHSSGNVYTHSSLPTCLAEGYIKTFCKDCDAFLKEETLPKNDDHAYLNGICQRCGKVEPCDHNWILVKELEPTCVEAGYEWWECSKCDYEKNGEVGKPTGIHDYHWVVIEKPTPTKNGVNEYKCKVCGHVEKSKVVKYTKWYYNNTMTSFGPMTRELIGGNNWQRVTPIDLTIDRTYVCDLVASNMYVIGTVEITVFNGSLTVEYYITGGKAVIHEETLMLYESLEAFRNGYGISAKVGSAINLAETVYEDNKIIVSLVLVGDYDAAHNRVKAFEADEVFLAELLENID